MKKWVLHRPESAQDPRSRREGQRPCEGENPVEGGKTARVLTAFGSQLTGALVGRGALSHHVHGHGGGLERGDTGSSTASHSAPHSFNTAQGLSIPVRFENRPMEKNGRKEMTSDAHLI